MSLSPFPSRDDRAAVRTPDGMRIVATIGDEERVMRVLTIKQNREWTDLLASTLTDPRVTELRIDSLEGLGALIGKASDLILDLVVAYDLKASLGGRDYLEANATDRQLYAVLQDCLREAFPWGMDVKTIMASLSETMGRPPESEQTG